MSTFLRLGGIAAPFAMGRISEAEMAFGGTQELSAWGHWTLGGDAASLLETGNTRSLTPMAAAPGYQPAYVEVSADDGAALQSGYVPALGASLTMTAVLRRPTMSGLAFVLGNRVGNDGLSCWIKPNGEIRAAIRGISSPYTLGTLAQNTWTFLAIGWYPGASQSVRTYVGGLGLEGYANTTPHYLSGAGLGFGNVGYVLNSSEVLHFAEGCIFDKVMTQIELDAVYARSRARMAARGITI